MMRTGSFGVLLLLGAILSTGCVAQKPSEAGHGRVDPPIPTYTITQLQELLARPGAMTLPADIVEYFGDRDEIPESALSVEVRIVDFSASADAGVEGYFRKRVEEIVNDQRYDEEDVGELFFMIARGDFDFTLQKGDEAAQVLLSRLDPSVEAAVKEILDEGASYFRFMTNDYGAERSSRDLIVVQPSTSDAGNRAIEIEIGCCGGY
jgi:hypothetical protein